MNIVKKLGFHKAKMHKFYKCYNNVITMLELVKPVVKVGNSAGVVLPKEWLNGTAKIVLVEKPLKIEQDVLGILKDYLEDIQGVYIVGSYARGEQEKDSDVDVIAISNSVQKKIVVGKYDIQITPLDIIKSTIRKYPIMIYPRLAEAKVLFNKLLLGELLNVKVTKNSFKEFYKDTVSMSKSNKELMELDKLDGEMLQSNSAVYSVFLRLRGYYLINCILKNKKYSKKDFQNWVIKNAKINREEYNLTYGIYKNIKDSKVIKQKVSIDVVEKLFCFLEKEAKKYGK